MNHFSIPLPHLEEVEVLLEDLVDHIGGRIGKAGKVRIVLQLQHLVQDELHVADGGIVTGHCKEGSWQTDSLVA